jgi:hypothetical protein
LVYFCYGLHFSKLASLQKSIEAAENNPKPLSSTSSQLLSEQNSF